MKYESNDELNYLASLLDELEEWEVEKFAAAVDFGEYNSVKDLINLTQNLDCFEFYSGIENEEDLGRYYIKKITLEIPEHLENYSLRSGKQGKRLSRHLPCLPVSEIGKYSFNTTFAELS